MLNIKNMHYLLGLGHWEIKLLCMYLIYKDRHREKDKHTIGVLVRNNYTVLSNPFHENFDITVPQLDAAGITRE